MATVSVPGGCNGPIGSGNGGYTAGLLASLVGEPASVSLRNPVPLDRDLAAVVNGDRVRILDGEVLVAEGEPEPDFALEVPGAVTVEAARAAMLDYAGRTDGPFSTCFVCGRSRPEALGVFAGPVAGTDLVASTWTPTSDLAGEDGSVRREIVWAALDCPTYFAAYRGEEETLAVLVRFSGAVEASIEAGTEHVVIGWPLGAEGRKREAGSAILSAEGEVLARTRALLVEPRQ